MNFLLYFLLCDMFTCGFAGLFDNFLYSGHIKCNHYKNLNYGVSEVRVFFYDFQKNLSLTFPIDVAVKGLTTAYNLDVKRKIIFFVPGYKSQINDNNEDLIRAAFSSVRNIYLITVDHSTYTSDRGGEISSYERSVKYAYYLGTAFGNFLAGLRAKGFRSMKIHCIGHSLGSQMLGYAGTRYTELTKEKIWRVTGLDPAGPCFSDSNFDDQIRSGIGQYVEVYHCNAGGLGTTSVLGDIDFFFNKKGNKQPSCNEGLFNLPGVGESFADSCNHKACVRYYALSVHLKDGFIAKLCDSYDHYSHGQCAGNQVTIAGYNNPGNATGIYYVSTELYGI